MKIVAKSKNPNGELQKYKDLIKVQMRLSKVIRIELTDYEYGISAKTGDFTTKTVKQLIAKGQKDALSLFAETKRDL